MKWHRLCLGCHDWDELNQAALNHGITFLGLMNTRPGKLHSHEIMWKGSPCQKWDCILTRKIMKLINKECIIQLLRIILRKCFYNAKIKMSNADNM